MNTITYSISQKTLGDLFTRVFQTEYFYEFLVDEDLKVMDILMLGIRSPDVVDSEALKGYQGSKKWMEMMFAAIEHTYPEEDIERRLAMAAKAAVHFRESMEAEAWFEFVSEPGKQLRKTHHKLVTMYIEAMIAAALESGHPTIMIDLLGLSIPRGDLLYQSGPFHGAILSYVKEHPDVVKLFKSGAPSKLLAQLAMKHDISGLGSLLDLEDRGPVFTNELGV